MTGYGKGLAENGKISAEVEIKSVNSRYLDIFLKLPNSLMNIEKINKLYDEGNTIVYWTARGSRKQKDWTELTRKQLNEWGAKYHELRCDKPFYDLFIEDKSLRIEEL